MGVDALVRQTDAAQRIPGERITERRVSYVAAALIELGIAPDEARRRGLVAVALVLGLEQLTRGGAASVVGSGDALQRTVISVLLGPS